MDDVLLAGNGMTAIDWVKTKLTKRFEIMDLGQAKLCVGL